MVYADIKSASPLAGSNIASGTWLQVIDKPRVLRKFGVAGGTALGDSVIEIFFGAKKIVECNNTQIPATTAGPVPDTQMKWYMGNEVLPAGQPLNIKATTVTATNYVISIDTPEIDG